MILAVLALVGCGTRGVDCTSDEVVVAKHGTDELTCGQLDGAHEYVELVAGRPADPGNRRLLQSALATSFKADPAGTRSTLAAVDAAARELAALRGFEAAERRATLAWESIRGDGGLLPEGDAARSLELTAAVWAYDDEEKLVLTEMDMEGWIFYASLCHEAQQGGPLTLSVGSRVGVYNDIRERFTYAPRAEQIALTAVGPFWWQAKDAWALASFERQQAWIAAAPLPPPMNATYLGYLGSVLEGDLPRHAHVLHEKLGPLGLGSP